MIECSNFPDTYKIHTRLAFHNATSISLDEFMQSLEESGSSSVDLYNGNFSLLLDLAPHMAALNVNVWEMPEISITTIYNDTAQHSLPIVMNLLSNAFYRLENCMFTTQSSSPLPPRPPLPSPPPPPSPST